jgi:hypothetical protein
MDFSSRGNSSQPHQPQQAVRTNVAAAPGANGVSAHSPKKRFTGDPRWFRFASVGLLFCVAILAIAITFSFYYNNQSEAKYVSTSDYQAVFLNNGQVYFGKIKVLNSRYTDLTNIFYLSNQQAQPSTKGASSTSNKFSLVKLGCELHAPYDQMIINNGQITFWENLRNNGQVVTAISKWYQQNPNGLQCSTSS